MSPTETRNAIGTPRAPALRDVRVTAALTGTCGREEEKFEADLLVIAEWTDRNATRLKDTILVYLWFCEFKQENLCCGLWVVVGGAVMLLKADLKRPHNYFSWSRPILTWRMLIKV